LLPFKVIDASLKGPVSTPLRGSVNGPIVQDSPYKPVLPLTVAFMVIANPLPDDSQVKPPVIVPGWATNGTLGDIPGTRVRVAESVPKTVVPAGSDLVAEY
jgi:hypothetical protein